MYDIHNHVLPGVDDGASGMRTSLRMLESAIHQGITHVACTPHANDRAGEQANTLFQSVFAELKAKVDEIELPVELGLAAEIMFGSELQQALRHPFSSFNGGGEYFLIEFPIETPFEIILNVIRASRRWQRRPVIAHFERYSGACKDQSQPRRICDAGGIISLDAGSLVGQFGKPMIRRSRRLLEWGVVDVLASDAHDDGKHGFYLKPGYEAAASWIGAPAARKLVLDCPRIIWEGQPWPSPNTSDST